MVYPVSELTPVSLAVRYGMCVIAFISRMEIRARKLGVKPHKCARGTNTHTPQTWSFVELVGKVGVNIRSGTSAQWAMRLRHAGCRGNRG